MEQNQNQQIHAKAGTNKLAFTLVELIVVITILAILGIIAFIALQGYSAQARDSKRVSDISNIKKSLELFSLSTGKYPKPDDFNTVSYSGELIWYQGKVGDQVTKNLSRNLNEKPTDPITEEEYTYSVTNSQTEFELLALYESDIIGELQVLNKIYAANFNFAKIDGSYNGLYARTSSFYIPTPSIINGNVWGNVDFADDETLIESQVITGGDNIPGESTGGLDITLSPYEGAITSDSTEEEKAGLVTAIQNAYSGSQLADNTLYADILSKTGTGEMVDFVDVVVLEIAEYSIYPSNGGLNVSGGESKSSYEVTDCQTQGQILPAVTTFLGCDTADIIVCSGEGEGFTVSACNLGATIASTDRTISRGYYFQWGRNKGFAFDNTSRKSTQIPNDSYDPDDDPYGFVWGDGLSDWIEERENYLWGVRTDNQQGPCPDGRHVPSLSDWTGLVNAGDGYSWNISGTTTEGYDFKTVLKLPYAGRRSGYDGDFYEVGEYGRYWSTVAFMWGDGAHSMAFIDSVLYPEGSDNRSTGQPIRCFKN